MAVGPRGGGLTFDSGIDIELAVNDGVIGGVVVRNQRILTATLPLAGHSAEDAVPLVSRLFAVCRFAQGVAGAQAIEQAAGLSVGPAHLAARRFLVLCETILEHGTRTAFDWPRLLGETPAIQTVKALRGALADMHRDVYPDGDWMRPGGGRLAPDSAAVSRRLRIAEQSLLTAVFVGEPPLDRGAWHHWVAGRATPAARLVAKIEREGLVRVGASDVTPLPALTQAALEARLAADVDGSFVARPDWDAEVRHTGPLARHATHPLVADFESGCGLAAHLAARLVELALGLREMHDFADALCEDAGLLPVPKAADGHGLGIVEAARGRLVHRVELQEGKVSRYQILAPTEWNFHPEGALVRGLVGQPAGLDPVWRVRLLVTAFDPCVAYTIRVA